MLVSAVRRQVPECSKFLRGNLYYDEALVGFE